MANFRLNRRALLRGLVGGSAVAVGLPTFEMMLNGNGDAYADGSSLPVRFMTFYWADGVNIARFEPPQTGPGWQAVDEMQPLDAYAPKMNVCTGLINHCQNPITHHEGMTVFNGYSFIQGGGLNTDAGGPTIDQLIADIITTQCPDVPVRAVHTQISKRVSTDGDGGTTAIAMSHRGTPGNLIAQTPQVNPQLVWETLFGRFDEPVDTSQPRKRVLDAVREDAGRLKTKLGKMDQQRLDAHLQGVDELENKIIAVGPSCALPTFPTETNESISPEPISAVTQAMASLIAYAFACDITRVATMMFKRFVSFTTFDEIGASNIHHSASHQNGSNTYHEGVVYSMQKFADVLAEFENINDGPDQTLLDNTIIYASTDCSTPWQHSIRRQPILLAGHGRGYLKNPGIHYQATPFNGDAGFPSAARNTSDVLLTCLRAFDPAAPSVGGDSCISTTPITEIIA
jgi:hypothetical protein